MPTPRKYATNAARQAAYRARCPAAPVARAVSTTPGERRWTALLGQAQGLVAAVTEEMAAYAAARSEAWQESDRGDAFTERLDAVEGILDQLREWAPPAPR